MQSRIKKDLVNIQMLFLTRCRICDCDHLDVLGKSLTPSTNSVYGLESRIILPAFVDPFIFVMTHVA